LFSTAVLLFSIGMLVQYRLYSDPEYNARNKAAAREEKMEALRTRYIMENYDPVKKQLMGLPATPAQPMDIDQLPRKEATYSLWNALTSSYTWIPVISLVVFGVAYSLCTRDGFLLWLQRTRSSCCCSYHFKRRQITRKHDALGALKGAISPWVCRNTDSKIQGPV
jgi:hypothetical protein